MKNDITDNNTPDERTQRGSKLLHDLKDHAQAAVDGGKKRSERIIGSRRHNALLRELGTVTYDAHLDGDLSFDMSKCGELLASLDALQPADLEPSAA